MPLKPGSSRKVISQNIHEMVAAGHPVKQAVAASLHNAHAKRKIDTNSSAHDAGHPDHVELRRRKMLAATQRMGKDNVAERLANAPRMGAPATSHDVDADSTYP